MHAQRQLFLRSYCLNCECYSEIPTRLAQGLESAAAIDAELVEHGFPYFQHQGLIAEITTAAEKCAHPGCATFRIWRDAANGMGNMVRSAPPDIAVREVATGHWDFNDAREARRYAG
jgi:hypothetical protein